MQINSNSTNISFCIPWESQTAGVCTPSSSSASIGNSLPQCAPPLPLPCSFLLVFTVHTAKPNPVHLYICYLPICNCAILLLSFFIQLFPQVWFIIILWIQYMIFIWLKYSNNLVLVFFIISCLIFTWFSNSLFSFLPMKFTLFFCMPTLYLFFGFHIYCSYFKT